MPCLALRSRRRAHRCPGGLGRALGILAVAWPFASSAQTIRGIVLEEGTTEAVRSATVEVRGADTTYTAVTDEKGWFHIALRREGQYRLLPSHLSYAAAGVDTVTVARHEIVTVVLRMGRAAIPLEPLVVTARTFHPLKGFYDRMERGKPGKFVKREFIERRLGAIPSQLLVMTPGVRLDRSDNNLTNTITLYGAGGRCQPDIYLDGLLVPRDTLFTIDDLTSAESLEGIEVYEGGMPIPAIFVSPIEGFRQCGVVAFWTRGRTRRPMTPLRWLLGVGAAGAFFLLTRM